MHLKTDFSEDFCVQMTSVIPGTIGNCSLDREPPLLTKIVLIVKSYFIQYNAVHEKYIRLSQKMKSFCKGGLVFGQLHVNLIISELQFVSVTVNVNLQLVCINFEV